MEGGCLSASFVIVVNKAQCSIMVLEVITNKNFLDM
jgi:hypothetical protein